MNRFSAAAAAMLLLAACAPRPDVRLDFGCLAGDSVAVACHPFSRADDFMAVMADTLVVPDGGVVDYSLPVAEPCIVTFKPFATSEVIPGGRRWMDGDVLKLYVAPHDGLRAGARPGGEGRVEFHVVRNALNRAIRELDMEWVNLREDDSLPSAAKPTVMYNVTAFPTKVVISPDGTVHDITVGERPEFYGRLDSLMAM